MPTLRLLPELEEALRQIPGVRAASVVTGPDAVPTEVHVLALPGKPAKQVVRDVQSLAMARFDIEIDHRIVSVVQIGEEDSKDTVLPLLGGDDTEAATRPSITAIMVRTSVGTSEAAVTLSAGDLLFEGRAEGSAASTHRPRLVAAATVDALQELLGQPCEVESAVICSPDGREVALTVLSILVPRGGRQLVTGSALVRDDEADAVARSVLSALNRQLAG